MLLLMLLFYCFWCYQCCYCCYIFVILVVIIIIIISWCCSCVFKYVVVASVIVVVTGVVVIVILLLICRCYCCCYNSRLSGVLDTARYVMLSCCQFSGRRFSGISHCLSRASHVQTIWRRPGLHQEHEGRKRDFCFNEEHVSGELLQGQAVSGARRCITL